ncbi:MAG: type II secretion system protein [Terrimicrobiaceae bacterium]|nr:type II secretion system protein [Terrimicrobiaceae bacterium]
MSHFQPRRHRVRAFSLLELLTVVGVIAIMMSLLIPSIAGFSSTAGRRGAVNVVMNTLEQARVEALQSGQTVYVAFADGNFPVEDMRNAAFLVFRTPTEEEAAAGRSFVVLKPWTRLPKDVFFRSQAGTVFPGTSKTFSGLVDELPQRFSGISSLPALSFTSSGTVLEPSQGTNLWLFLEDRSTRSANTLFEKISLSRYTGRVQLDITATGT